MNSHGRRRQSRGFGRLSLVHSPPDDNRRRRVRSGQRESNPRPTVWKTAALPLSYTRMFGGECRSEPARPFDWHQRKDLNPDERSWKPPCCRYITLVIGTRAGNRTPIGRSTTGRSAVELRERVWRALLRQGFGGHPAFRLAQILRGAEREAGWEGR